MKREIMSDFVADCKTLSLHELTTKYNGPANVMYGIRRLLVEIEVLRRKCRKRAKPRGR